MDQAGNITLDVKLKPHTVPGSTLLKSIRRNWELYLLITPVVIYFFVFNYIPMYGVQLAFKDFTAKLGIWGSPWVGFQHFQRFFNSYVFMDLIKNTVGLSLYSLALGFPAPIILALAMNEVKRNSFKRIVQTATYAPHFLSTVVMAGMIIAFLNPRNGIVNLLITMLGGEPVSFMTEAGLFKTIYVLTGVWQNTGWGSIIYMAALAGISPELYEAATMDGAGKMRKIWHINIPGILPAATILLIMEAGKIMSVGFEKVYLLQNSLNLESSEIIATYVYRVGLIGANYSFSTAVSLFNAVINFILLALVNAAAKRLSETSLW